MTDRTIVCDVGADLTLKLDPRDAEFLQLTPGARLVMQVRRNEQVPGLGMQATLTLAEGNPKDATKRRPKAFQV